MAGTSNTFQINESVRFLHDSGYGIIRRIDGFLFIVEDENGFERPFRACDLVKVHPHSNVIDELDIPMEDSVQELSVRTITQPQEFHPFEIDLHIEELTDSHVGMNNAQILALQMQSMRTFFQRAKSRRVSPIIVIHGVGEGVLKAEVRTYFSKMNGVTCSDADFRKYGQGATRVDIRYTQLID
jgi:hypothetical protein